MTWKERAEKAEAALATEKVAREKAEADLTHILTSCGKGWVSPETHAAIVFERDEALALMSIAKTQEKKQRDKLSAAVDGLGIIHSHFVVHTQVCADKSCWKCYIGKLAAQILDKIEE